jgi:hypothetical protein
VNVKRFKAMLMARGFTQREGIDYNETFSTVSAKYSLRVVNCHGSSSSFQARISSNEHSDDISNSDLKEDV